MAVTAGKPGEPLAASGPERGHEHEPGLVQAVSARVAHLIGLAAAEARLAVVSVIVMVSLAGLAVFGLLAAWGLLLAVLLHYAPAIGLEWPLAAVVLAFIHVLVSALLWHKALGLSRALTLPALRRSIGDGGKAPDSHVAAVPSHR